MKRRQGSQLRVIVVLSRGRVVIVVSASLLSRTSHGVLSTDGFAMPSHGLWVMVFAAGKIQTPTGRL